MTTIQQSENGGHALKFFWNSKFLSYFDGASRYLLIETDFHCQRSIACRVTTQLMLYCTQTTHYLRKHLLSWRFQVGTTDATREDCSQPCGSVHAIKDRSDAMKDVWKTAT